jgi:hypothetical protein
MMMDYVSAGSYYQTHWMLLITKDKNESSNLLRTVGDSYPAGNSLLRLRY